MSINDETMPSYTSTTQHRCHTSDDVLLDTQRTFQKRKSSEADLDDIDIILSKTLSLLLMQTADITTGNPIREAAEKGNFGHHTHISKTGSQLTNGLHGALSKDMARVYLTVHALRGAIRQWEIKMKEQNGILPEHHKDMMNLKSRLVAAERRERRQVSILNGLSA